MTVALRYVKPSSCLACFHRNRFEIAGISVIKHELWRKPAIRELSVEELGQLIHLSHTESRHKQCDYLIGVGGAGSQVELDYMLSVARNNGEAVSLSRKLDQEGDARRFPEAKRLSKAGCDAVNFFLHQSISGEFGPDDSRDGRSYVFLKNNHVLPRALSIFLENLVLDAEGNVLN